MSRASRKYNKNRSYIYFWKPRWDGTGESLACQSRRPHNHPNRHTQEELRLIQDMRRGNPDLGTVCGGGTSAGQKAFIESCVEQMTYPGQRVQVDVKVVPRRCIADPEPRLFQYTAIDEFPGLRFLAAYPEQPTYSSTDFLRRLTG